jgi:hypothetical protein
MLPIRWILPVGGVLLAIALLALAFNPPDAAQMLNVAPVRSTFIEWGERPEWRQFIILSAIQRRADELNRLRELPDTPARTDAAPAPPEVAGLPADRSDSDAEDNDEIGLSVQPPAATAPVDIVEALSIELPVAVLEEKPPVIKTPQRVKSRNQNRIKAVQHVRRRARALASRESLSSNNFFEQPFGTQTGQRPAVNTNNYFGNQISAPYNSN